jgi:hypothetical protein
LRGTNYLITARPGGGKTTPVRRLATYWLDGPAVVVATVAERGGGLIADVKGRRDCEPHELRRRGFDELPEFLEAEVRRSLGG